MKFCRLLVLVFVFAASTACGLTGDSNQYTNPKALAIDSANDRLFVFESNKEVFVRTASTNNGIGDQPVINEDDTETFFNLLPDLVTHVVAYPDGSTTRLFIFGSKTLSDGTTVTNQIQVLNYNNGSFSTVSFSPITLSDGDNSTTESDNAISKVVLDDTASQIFIADSSANLVYVIDAETGATVQSPIELTSSPVDLSLTDGRVYVCHDDSPEITVIDVDDYTTSSFETGVSCQNLAVVSNDSTTLLALKQNTDQIVHLWKLNVADFSLTDIATSDSGFASGELTSGAGLTSDVTEIVLTVNSDNRFDGYFAEQDGNVQFVEFNSSLTNYTHETFSTSALNYLQGAVYFEGGVAEKVYFIAEAGFLLRLQKNSDDNLDASLDS